MNCDLDVIDILLNVSPKLLNEVITLSDNFLGCLYDEKSLPRCIKVNKCLQTVFTFSDL